MSFLASIAGGARRRGIGGNDTYTKVLNHFDNNLTDLSPIGLSWTANGSAAASATQSKFGGYSLSLNGSSQYLTATYNTTNHDWWTSDFNIDCWVYYNSLTGASTGFNGPTLIGNMEFNTGTNYWSFGVRTDGKIGFFYFNGSSQSVSTTATVSTATWTHIAMKKNGSGISLAKNGVWESLGAVSGTPQSSTGSPLTLGACNSLYSNVYVDELRISKGVERWATDFTPPIEEYS